MKFWKIDHRNHGILPAFWLYRFLGFIHMGCLIPWFEYHRLKNHKFKGSAAKVSRDRNSIIIEFEGADK